MNAERIANRWVHPVWHILGQFLRRSTSGRSRAFSSCSPAAPRRKVCDATQMVSTRFRKAGPSERYAITLGATGWVNEGQPVPDSNFSEASKRTVSQHTQE